MNDVDEIKQVKYRYLRAIDTKSWGDLHETLADDVTADYGEEGQQGGRMQVTGREHLVEFLRTSLGPAVITDHSVSHPIISVTGDRATGSWYLQDRVVMTDLQLLLVGAAYYTDSYVRTGDGWRIATTGFRRTYEATVALADLPSFALTIGSALNG